MWEESGRATPNIHGRRPCTRPSANNDENNDRSTVHCAAHTKEEKMDSKVWVVSSDGDDDSVDVEDDAAAGWQWLVWAEKEGNRKRKKVFCFTIIGLAPGCLSIGLHVPLNFSKIKWNVCVCEYKEAKWGRGEPELKCFYLKANNNIIYNIYKREWTTLQCG